MFPSNRSERLRSPATHGHAFFATGRDGEACKYQTQPLCEQIACMRAGGNAISNCDPPSSAFRRLFKGAAVQEVEIRGYEAGRRFSTGQEVVFLRSTWAGWLVDSQAPGQEPQVLQLAIAPLADQAKISGSALTPASCRYRWNRSTFFAGSGTVMTLCPRDVAGLSFSGPYGRVAVCQAQIWLGERVAF